MSDRKYVFEVVTRVAVSNLSSENEMEAKEIVNNFYEALFDNVHRNLMEPESMRMVNTPRFIGYKNITRTNDGKWWSENK